MSLAEDGGDTPSSSPVLDDEQIDPEGLDQQIKSILGPHDKEELRSVCLAYLDHWLSVNDMKQHSTDMKQHSTAPDSPTPDQEAETHTLRPLFLPSRRLQVWKCLLGCADRDETAMRQWDQKLGLPEQRIINLDCVRTRPDDIRLDAIDRTRMEELLTCYCTGRGVTYKQGLNEVLAPIYVAAKQAVQTEGKKVVDQAFSDQDWKTVQGATYNVLYALVATFLPSLFLDEEFQSLRAIFAMFALLLQYHAPALARCFHRQGVSPELFATPWFLTLFAHKLPLDLAWLLWDVYIVEGDPLLNYFIGLALLVSDQDSLLSCDPHLIPSKLNNLRPNKLNVLLPLARKLRSRTPLSFREQLFSLSFTLRHRPKQALEISVHLSLLPCLAIPASEVVRQCFCPLLENGALKFIVFDARPSSDFQSGRLPLAVHLDPELLQPGKESELQKALSGVAALEGCHVCLLGWEEEDTEAGGASSPSKDLCAFVTTLLERNIAKVSIVEGGFQAVHKEAELRLQDRIETAKQEQQAKREQEEAAEVATALELPVGVKQAGFLSNLVAKKRPSRTGGRPASKGEEVVRKKKEQLKAWASSLRAPQGQGDMSNNVNAMLELVDHNVARCLVCNGEIHKRSQPIAAAGKEGEIRSALGSWIKAKADIAKAKAEIAKAAAREREGEVGSWIKAKADRAKEAAREVSKEVQSVQFKGKQRARSLVAKLLANHVNIDEEEEHVPKSASSSVVRFNLADWRDDPSIDLFVCFRVHRTAEHKDKKDKKEKEKEEKEREKEKEEPGQAEAGPVNAGKSNGNVGGPVEKNGSEGSPQGQSGHGGSVRPDEGSEKEKEEEKEKDHEDKGKGTGKARIVPRILAITDGYLLALKPGAAASLQPPPTATAPSFPLSTTTSTSADSANTTTSDTTSNPRNLLQTWLKTDLKSLAPDDPVNMLLLL
eukprot:g1691.t1